MEGGREGERVGEGGCSEWGRRKGEREREREGEGEGEERERSRRRRWRAGAAAWPVHPVKQSILL
jgi:hypothetical protein